MRIKSIEDQLIYVPNRKKGESLFNGEAIVNDDDLEFIGHQEINYIKEKISSIIENRKEMYGNNYPQEYGLHYIQKFYDLKNRFIIKAKDLINVEKEIKENPLSSFPEIIRTPKYEERQSKIHDFILEIENMYPSFEKRSNISAFNAIKTGDFFN